MSSKIYTGFLHTAFVTALILCPWSFFAEASSQCFAKSNHNGTFSFFLNHSIQHCPTYNWNVNGTVYANEVRFINTFVESCGPHFCTFYSCFGNVTYKNVCTGVLTNCSGLCSTLSSLKERTTPAALDHGSIVEIAAVILLILGALCTAVYKREKLKKYLCALRDACCKCSYTEAPRNDCEMARPGAPN